MYETSRTDTENIWEAIYTQRAIREWYPEPVPREMLVKIIEAATRPRAERTFSPGGSSSSPAAGERLSPQLSATTGIPTKVFGRWSNRAKRRRTRPSG